MVVPLARCSPVAGSSWPAPPRASADSRVHTTSLGTPNAADSDRAEDSLNRLREVAAKRLRSIPGVTYAVGGDVARHNDEIAIQAEKMPWVVGFVLLLTFLIMFGAFRSVIVAITAIVLSRPPRSVCW
ncbi:MMPL family transporter [Planomonospora sp. ID67723]|uniref:MMPL family transporter n=1 Tax=Planomonospora sp. ID67723 TaxID=2738134 RepID=UPI0018C3A4D6|nr:MMPL family transporter [Planomonospora sp. ID67723]MBG0831686.1 MMPL family transporter [Planomonospora sp. ID67723]